MVLTAVSFSTLLYVVLLPLALLHVLALLIIPCLLAGGRIGAAMKAIYCYLLQAVGISLMTTGALPAVYGVIEKFSVGAERFSAEMYLALLILFATGGLTFLWHERIADKIDDASRKVPALLFWYSFKLLGYFLVVGSAISLLVTMLLTRGAMPATWWISPIVILLYGLLLSWCTRSPSVKQETFRTMAVAGATPAKTKAKRK
jgi:hypothetical protein